MAEDAWVHDHWVSLHSAPSMAAPIKARLNTNTKVEVAARKGEWCAVRASASIPDGFVACRFLGTAPLTLNEAEGSPARLFWIAPSVGRLVAYGALLRHGAEYKRMFAALQPEETARISPLPEFDAAKKLMQVGVVPMIEAEMDRGGPVDPEHMEYYRLIKPAAIRRSFFKDHGDVALLSEADADGLAAVTRSHVSVKATAPPVGYVAHHDGGPEISGISGFGDVGEAEVRFAPELLVYSLLPNGLLSGDLLKAQRVEGGHDDYGETCGKHYLGKSFGSPEGLDPRTIKPAPGFPRPSESMLMMASFVTAKPLNARRLHIKSRAARISGLPQNAADGGSRVEVTLATSAAKVVLHEVDFDADGVADLLVWDAPSIGDMSGGLNLRRAWYINIDGWWYPAGAMDEQECT